MSTSFLRTIWLACTTLLLAGWCLGQNTDIEFVHGSFCGGNDEEFFGLNPLSINPEGNVLMVTATTSNNAPTTANAQQAFLNGFINYYIALLDANGEPIYASYFGGPVTRRPVAAFTESGNLVLAGESTTPGFPVSPGAHQEEYPGGLRSGTLTFFDLGFEPIWSTYVGGNEADLILDVAVDQSNNVYICGGTLSADLATAGAHSEEIIENEDSGFLAKYNAQGDLLYFTYFQGNGSTVFTNCTVNSEGTKLYLSGYTNATSGVAFGGIEDEYQGGDRDIFVSCFDIESSQFLWSRYFGGPAFDNSWKLKLGPNDEIVLYGSTRSVEGIASPGAHQEIPSNTFTGLADDLNRFIAVLDQNGETLWGTYFGELLRYSENFGLSVNDNEVLISGLQTGAEEILMGNPLESELLEDGSDFIAKFDLETGAQIWGTYIGNGTDTRIFDLVHMPGNRLFTLGSAGSNNANISEDAWQSQFGGMLDLYYAIFEDMTLGTNSYARPEPLEIYPNPTNDKVNFLWPKTAFTALNVEIFDLSGRSIKSINNFNASSEIDVSDLPNGLYILQAADERMIYSGKLVISD